MSQYNKGGCGCGIQSLPLWEEVYDRRIATQADLGKRQRPISKIIRAKGLDM
jgi:hypothetical protein